jgi:hypothetical protein
LTVTAYQGDFDDTLRVRNEQGLEFLFHHKSLAFASARNMKVGDKFTVYRECQPKDYGNAVNWNPEMEKFINTAQNVGDVSDLHWDKRYMVFGHGRDLDWSFDWRCVKPVNEGDIEMAKKGVKPAKKAVAKKKVVKKVKPKSLALLLKKAVAGEFARCHFAIRFTGGDRFYEDAPCHAQFKRPWRGKIDSTNVLEAVEHIQENLDHIINVRPENQTKESTTKAYKAYVKWMLNESPWKDCFITKSVSHALRYGVYYNVDMNHACLLSAAVALRIGSEYTNMLYQFQDHLSKGKSPLVSWLLANIYDATTMKRKYLEGTHHTIVKSQDVVQFFNFFKGRGWNATTVDPKRSFRIADNYAICDAIADQRTKKETLGEWLNKKCPAFAAAGAWEDVGRKATQAEIDALEAAIIEELNK